MEALNAFINKSLSNDLLDNMEKKMDSAKNSCLKVGFFCGAMVVVVFVAPVEAIVRLALAIITSIALIGYYVGGDTGTKFAVIPVKFFETTLKSAEITVSLFKELFEDCLGCATLCRKD